jgi:serine/threonine-protein kinase
MISSSRNLVDALRQHQLLSPQQLAELTQLAHGRCGYARPLAKMLIQRGWLAVYQVNQLLHGRGGELVIGPYLVLEKLGQGGLSWVYKARHREHQNIVAIKMIRPEVFASPEGRQAFLLEVEAMARLDHPNVVQFCDADQFNDTYYFAMEYIEGTDLGKVIRLSGALPVREACDYVRQAALGLQHAFERNLVHRDIKPVNLFLTHVPDEVAPAGFLEDDRDWNSQRAAKTMPMKPLIKILDWGLANLKGQAAGTGPSGENVAKSVVGTADYLSPEQARNANAVDIRSDLYSLGCTFYYLLTGQPPFPDGSLMQKIMRHQTAEPRPVSDFRADVPGSVIQVLKRMLAKKPEDRFRAPASAALALQSCAREKPAGGGFGRATMHGVLPPGHDDTLPPTAHNAETKPQFDPKKTDLTGLS